MATTFIYALCEPGTRTVRYIGMTNNLKRRLKEHLNRGIHQQTPLGHWLRSLVTSKKIPKMIALREVDSGAGPDAEMRFIRLARGCKMTLVNGTDGGEGVQNPSLETRNKRRDALTPEVRQKMSAANSGSNNPFYGAKHTPEAREKMSLCNSGENNPMFGRSLPKWTHTEETKAKLRHPRSEDSKAKQRATIAEKKRLKLCVPIS